MGLLRDDYLCTKTLFFLLLPFIKYLCEVAWKVFPTTFPGGGEVINCQSIETNTKRRLIEFRKEKNKLKLLNKENYSINFSVELEGVEKNRKIHLTPHFNKPPSIWYHNKHFFSSSSFLFVDFFFIFCSITSPLPLAQKKNEIKNVKNDSSDTFFVNQ